jgi:hypothetical protein
VIWRASEGERKKEREREEGERERAKASERESARQSETFSHFLSRQKKISILGRDTCNNKKEKEFEPGRDTYNKKQKKEFDAGGGKRKGTQGPSLG